MNPRWNRSSGDTNSVEVLGIKVGIPLTPECVLGKQGIKFSVVALALSHRLFLLSPRNLFLFQNEHGKNLPESPRRDEAVFVRQLWYATHQSLGTDLNALHGGNRPSLSLQPRREPQLQRGPGSSHADGAPHGARCCLQKLWSQTGMGVWICHRGKSTLQGRPRYSGTRLGDGKWRVRRACWKWQLMQTMQEFVWKRTTTGMLVATE